MTETPGDRAAAALLLAATAGYVCFAFSWFSLAAFLTPVVAELGLSSAGAGLVVGAVPLTYVPFALLSGLLIDRVGPRRAIGAGLALVGLAQTVRSVATGLPTLLLPTLVLGLGGTGLTFGLPKLVAVLFDAERTGRASAVYMLGSFAGTAAAFGLGRPFLGPALGGWRPLFRWSGLVVVVAAAVWLVGTWGRGLDAGRGPAAGADGAERLAAVRRDLAAITGHRGMQLLVVVGTASLLSVHGTMGWLTAVLEDRGFAAGVAAGATTLVVAGRVVGTLALPTLSDVFEARRGVLVASGALLALGAAGLVFAGTSTAATVLAVVVVGLGFGGLLTLIRVLPIEYAAVGPDRTGTATGLVYSVGQVGGFLGPFLLGALYDATGTHAAGLSMLSAAGVLALLAASAMPETDA